MLSRTQTCGVELLNTTAPGSVGSSRRQHAHSHLISFSQTFDPQVGESRRRRHPLHVEHVVGVRSRGSALLAASPARRLAGREVEGEVRGRREPPLRTHTSTHRVVGPPGQHTDRQPAFSPLPRAGTLFSRLGPARPSRSSEDGWLQSSATSMLLAARMLASQDRAVCLPRTTDE